jgi:hypothetical protein
MDVFHGNPVSSEESFAFVETKINFRNGSGFDIFRSGHVHHQAGVDDGLQEERVVVLRKENDYFS